MGFYNYLGAWLPTKENPRNLGAKKGTLPKHSHEYDIISSGRDMYTNYGRDGKHIMQNTSTAIKGLNSANVVAGDKVEPLSNIIRYLQKI